MACLVRDQLLAEHPEAELYLVDTLQASVAEGLLVYEAIQQRDKGLTARELAEWASEARFFVDAEFMVEDLESLRRGGRIPGSVAYAGSKLDVKPLLTIATDGKLSLSGVARGRKKGIKQLVEYYQETRGQRRSRPLRRGGPCRLPEGRRPPQGDAGAAGREHPVLGVRHRPGHRQPCRDPA